jgi:magnesium and cobalt transporter
MSETDNSVPNKHYTWLEKLYAFLKRLPQNKAQLMTVLREAEEHDVLSVEILGMIENILQVSEMQVREVMVPKAQIVTLAMNKTLDELLPTVIESGHSRFPVINPATNEITGILLAKDLLKYGFNRPTKTFDISKILRPANFVPQSKRLDILLREFRINRNHLAIVADEYGHYAGLVTIEDVLEQIVGEIEDEYDIDEDTDDIKKLNDGSFIVKATTLIEDFNEYFKTDFSDIAFDTIGGIVLKEFSHLPKRGETIKIGKLRFKVLHSDKRRIHLLEVKLEKKK